MNPTLKKLGDKCTVLPETWLRGLSPSTVPKSQFIVKYTRSSGPGGQNVNKVSSKCTLKLNEFSQPTTWIPQEVQQQLISKKMRYYNPTSDTLVIQSDKFRSRDANRQDCLEKLVETIKTTCFFTEPTEQATVDRWNSIKKNSNERRLRNKKLSGQKKKARYEPTFE
ncbi:LAMI_0E04610g1_1 [Lachancea mirantina]|uniref:LAMI_0E04610g1_1 n=1 Tax=Lachancea mirantina TaxID=1230905 RepID=A0A1G4JKG5_9SACH|nr:LAMI_0E04610g1_1 [Lachancea mirantina]